MHFAAWMARAPLATHVNLPSFRLSSLRARGLQFCSEQDLSKIHKSRTRDYASNDYANAFRKHARIFNQQFGTQHTINCVGWIDNRVG